MDRVTRKLEREALEGEPEARVRLAQHYLRTERCQEALERVEGLSEPDACAIRCASLLHLGQPGAAADAAAEALRGDPHALREDLLGDLARSLLDATQPGGVARLQTLRRCAQLGSVASEPLRPMLADPDPLVRLQLARNPALAEALRDDPVAIVRHQARGAPSIEPFPREPMPTRLFSAHGPDFETGHFVGFESSCQARLTFFEADLFWAVGRLLHLDTPVLARGRGYGLGVVTGDAVGDLEEKAAAVNAARVLPCSLRVDYGQMFDHLQPREEHQGGELHPEDELIASFLARDMTRHPARLESPGHPHTFARLLERFPPGRSEPTAPVDDLLTEAEGVYGPVGVRALELFLTIAGQPRPRRRGIHDRR